MMPLLTFCAFYPAFILTGRQLVRQAAGFIHEQEGKRPRALPGACRLVLLFAAVAALVVTRGLVLTLPAPEVLRDLLLTGWCLLLSTLDLARRWLPLRHTSGFIASGLLFSLLPGAAVTLPVAALNGLVMFTLLSVFRRWANRHGPERFGQGDVWLLAGFSAWLTLPVTAGLTLCALGLIALRHLAGLTGLMARAREVPFAPWFSLCLAASILAQRFPFSTG